MLVKVSKKARADIESPGTFDIAVIKFVQVFSSKYPDITRTLIWFMMLFANKSEPLDTAWIVLVAIWRSYLSWLVVRMCKIRCYTLSLVIRKDGRKLKIFNDKILACGSLLTRLFSILLRKTSLFVKRVSIWALHFWKIWVTIWARN